MTRAEDIAYAASLGVDAFGLIFYPPSPRAVTLEQAAELCAHLPPFLSPVAVVVNPKSELVEDIINKIPIALLQFHGEESPEFCAQFGFPFIKSIPVTSANQVYESMLQYDKAQALLLDSSSQHVKGGSGSCFDWRLIPDSLNKDYILAGGLNAENVEQALHVCTPYALDVCSGIELNPGVKDHKKMGQFMQAVWSK